MPRFISFVPVLRQDRYYLTHDTAKIHIFKCSDRVSLTTDTSGRHGIAGDDPVPPVLRGSTHRTTADINNHDETRISQ